MHFMRLMNIPTPVWLCFEEYNADEKIRLHAFNEACLNACSLVDVNFKNWETTTIETLAGLLGYNFQLAADYDDGIRDALLRVVHATIAQLEYAGFDPYNHTDTSAMYDGAPWLRYHTLAFSAMYDGAPWMRYHPVATRAFALVTQWQPRPDQWVALSTPAEDYDETD